MLKKSGMMLMCAALSACAMRHLPAAHTAMAAHYPEGPVVTDDGLLFVEYATDRVMRWRDGKVAPVWHGAGCGPAGLAAAGDGTLWIACHARHQLRHVRLGAAPRTLRTYDIPYPNDMARDGHGGLYVTASGIFDKDAPVVGEIYYVSARGTLSRVASAIHYSNGIALSHDGTVLQVSEHLQNRVRTYRVEAPGKLAPGFATFDLTAYAAHPDSADPTLVGPDGMGIDKDGHLWVAQYAGGRLLRLAKDGQVRKSVTFSPPFINVTNVDARADGRLFVTVISDDAEAGHPGAVVALRPELWGGDHVVCAVDPPQVTCMPRAP